MGVLHDRDRVVVGERLPRQPRHQRTQLLGIERRGDRLVAVRPDEAPLVEAPRGQAIATALKHKQLRALVTGRAAPNTLTTRARIVSVPARMSSGSTANQIASTRINATTLAATGRTALRPIPASED